MAGGGSGDRRRTAQRRRCSTFRTMKERSLRCFAVAAPGLEPFVLRELEGLGMAGRAEPGGVSWEGDIASVYRANLWLRTATRVLVRIARFRATSFWELERRSASLPWSSVVRPGTAVTFRVTARKSKLYHTDAIAERLGRSVVAAVSGVRLDTSGSAVDDEGETDDSAIGTGEATPGREMAAGTQLFVVRISRDELTLSADSSGEPLYRRGYRQAVAKAPMRETLAAAVLMAAGWQPGEALLDPFCGAGTIPLEAALWSAGVAPGIASSGRQPRGFTFSRWPGFKGEVWRSCIEDARMMARKSELVSAPVIRGSDRDGGAIAAARANAERAGLTDRVEFVEAAVSALTPPDVGPGWIVTNPPYGVRVGDGSDVRRLYAAFGRAVRERAAGWRLALLSPDPRLDGIVAGEAGVALEERLRTQNGGIPVHVAAER